MGKGNKITRNNGDGSSWNNKGKHIPVNQDAKEFTGSRIREGA